MDMDIKSKFLEISSIGVRQKTSDNKSSFRLIILQDLETDKSFITRVRDDDPIGQFNLNIGQVWTNFTFLIDRIGSIKDIEALDSRSMCSTNLVKEADSRFKATGQEAGEEKQFYFKNKNTLLILKRINVKEDFRVIKIREYGTDFPRVVIHENLSRLKIVRLYKINLKTLK